MKWQYEDRRIFNVDTTGQLMAELVYSLEDSGEIVIERTFVNPELRGQGIAVQLMETALVYFREKGFKVTATCSYAHSYLQKNRQLYADIISTDFDKAQVACKIN